MQNSLLVMSGKSEPVVHIEKLPLVKKRALWSAMQEKSPDEAKMINQLEKEAVVTELRKRFSATLILTQTKYRNLLGAS